MYWLPKRDKCVSSDDNTSIETTGDITASKDVLPSTLLFNGTMDSDNMMRKISYFGAVIKVETMRS